MRRFAEFFQEGVKFLWYASTSNACACRRLASAKLSRLLSWYLRPKVQTLDDADGRLGLF